VSLLHGFKDELREQALGVGLALPNMAVAAAIDFPIAVAATTKAFILPVASNALGRWRYGDHSWRLAEERIGLHRER